MTTSPGSVEMRVGFSAAKLPKVDDSGSAVSTLSMLRAGSITVCDPGFFGIPETPPISGITSRYFIRA